MRGEKVLRLDIFQAAPPIPEGDLRLAVQEFIEILRKKGCLVYIKATQRNRPPWQRVR